jgi:pimeloyl-ACP methyl ester carboxylesterase
MNLPTSPMPSACLDGYGIRAHTLGPQHAGNDTVTDVFLVHGMVDSGRTWTPLLPALAGCRVHRLELPWSGADGVAWPSRRSAIDWLEAALALCPAGRGVFVGHSFGATVLLDWLLADPRALAAVQGLVLLAPFYCGARRTVDWDQLDKFARGVAVRFEEGLRVRPGGDRLSPALRQAMAGKLSERVLPDAMIEMLRVFLRSKYWRLDEIAVPVLLVTGEDDTELAWQSALDLAACLPHADWHPLAGCGHYTMHEQPQRLRDLVAAFVCRFEPAREAA